MEAQNKLLELRSLIANDATAISYQTLAQYRTMLLKYIDKQIAEGKEIPDLNFFRTNILLHLSKEEMMILRDWLNSYDDPGKEIPAIKQQYNSGVVDCGDDDLWDAGYYTYTCPHCKKEIEVKSVLAEYKHKEIPVGAEAFLGNYWQRKIAAEVPHLMTKAEVIEIIKEAMQSNNLKNE